MSGPPWETSNRETLRVTFDEDPEAYDRSRPVAPDTVFDDVVTLAALGPGSTVVEIGPGTGQATRPLAERGLHVTALELGPRLAERARANLARFPNVEVLTSSFELWDPGTRRFDAVFACNSFHWVDPEVRFAKPAALLKPGGHLVVVATPWVVPDHAERFWWDVQDDYVAVAGTREDPADEHPDKVEDLGPLIEASGRYEEVTIRRHLFPVTFTAETYALNLSTQSGIKEFPPAAQKELIARITRRVVEQGGTVTAHLLAILAVAEVRASPE